MEKKAKSIHRVPKDKDHPYVRVDKEYLYNKNLSLKVKGLFTFILSKPNDWQIYVSALAKELKEGRGSIGKSIQELQDAGYIKRERETDHRGRWNGYRYRIYERPGYMSNISTSPKPDIPSTVIPSTGNPSTGNAALLRNESNKELHNLEEKEGKEQDLPPSLSFSEFLKALRRAGKRYNTRFRITKTQCELLFPLYEEYGSKIVRAVFTHWLTDRKFQFHHSNSVGDLKFFLVDFEAAMSEYTWKHKEGWVTGEGRYIEYFEKEILSSDPNAIIAHDEKES